MGGEDPLEKEMATHSIILAWEIPWMEEPGQLQSMGLQRVGYNRATGHIVGYVLYNHFTKLCFASFPNEETESEAQVSQLINTCNSSLLLRCVFPCTRDL